MQKSKANTLALDQDKIVEIVTICVSLNWLHPTAEILLPLRDVVKEIAEENPEFVLCVYDVMQAMHGACDEDQKKIIDDLREKYAQ